MHHGVRPGAAPDLATVELAESGEEFVLCVARRLVCSIGVGDQFVVGGMDHPDLASVTGEEEATLLEHTFDVKRPDLPGGALVSRTALVRRQGRHGAFVD